MADIAQRMRNRKVTRWVHSTGTTPRTSGYSPDKECIEAAEEIERLRAALAGLVQVYVIDGAATTPASEIGDAWKAAQRALLGPND